MPTELKHDAARICPPLSVPSQDWDRGRGMKKEVSRNGRKDDCQGFVITSHTQRHTDMIKRMETMSSSCPAACEVLTLFSLAQLEEREIIWWRRARRGEELVLVAPGTRHTRSSTQSPQTYHLLLTWPLSSPPSPVPQLKIISNTTKTNRPLYFQQPTNPAHHSYEHTW